MSEEIIKKAEELKEAAEFSEAKELSEEELDGATGGAFGFGFLKNYLEYQEKEREAAAKLAQMECPACKKRGARIDNMRIVCNSCGHVIR